MMISMVMVMMVMVFLGRLRFTGAAGELVNEFDELIRRGVMLALEVACLDAYGSILKDGQVHFRLHLVVLS